jgi:hypothetical protein
MFHRWAALVLVLALSALPAKQAAGQQSSSQPRERKLGVLGQNYPNPFNPETRIPFSIPACPESGGQVTITLRVYNVLAQVVAYPVLDGPGKATQNLVVPCGADYVARWDGKILGSGREAASGVVIYQLVVNGKVIDAKKAFVAK